MHGMYYIIEGYVKKLENLKNPILILKSKGAFSSTIQQMRETSAIQWAEVLSLLFLIDRQFSFCGCSRSLWGKCFKITQVQEPGNLLSRLDG